MHPDAARWFAERTYAHQDWTAAQVAAQVAAGGHRVSVVIPAKDEEATVAAVVAGIRRELIERQPVVDELVVIDSDSTDATAQVAADAGASVHAAAAIAPHLGSHPGKGEALWKSLFVTTGDLLVFVDADLTRWGPHFVTGLLGPLLADPGTVLVKGFYDRLLERDGEPSTQGGRVTELVARPVLDLWWPALAAVVQPLAGEWAARRSLMESIAVPTGYGVELATLLDSYERHGLEAIAQVDLGARGHTHQRDHDLAVMAAELLAVAHARCPGTAAPPEERLHQYTREGGWRERPVPTHHRGPATATPGFGTPQQGGTER